MSAQQMTALVVAADDPLDNRVKVGKRSMSTVRILIDAEPPIYVARGFKLDRDHWPVRGMELPVTIDPAKPDQFEIDWDQVPSIEDRAAANDPNLADPAGAHKKVMEALIASGAAGPDTSGLPQGARETVLSAQVAEFKAGGDTGLSHFKESLENAGQQPAPAGKTRAVVLIAASEATLRTEGGDADGSGGHQVRDRHGKHDTVLAVNVPGNAPYAVFKPNFKHKRGKGAAPGAGLPALVSSSDPTDVEVLWDELLSVKDQSRQTAAEAMQTAQARMAAAAGKIGEEQAATGVPQTPAMPQMPSIPAGAPAPQIPEATRAMMVQNAKAALQFTTDPAMRKMLIDQYRAAGIEIDAED